MEKQPVTPTFSYNWNAEDSGYHTSFTPGSFECSDIADENYQYNVNRRTRRKVYPYYVDELNRTPDCNIKNVLRDSNKATVSPHKRRGIKRSYPEETENTDVGYISISTPTSNISGELDRLRFSDHKKYSPSIISTRTEDSNSLVVKSESCSSDSLYYATIPTTPIKKICKNDCKLNSPRRNNKLTENPNWIIHSLTCDKKALKLKVSSGERKSKSSNEHDVKPHQKIDIIKFLHQKANALPPLKIIFSYLNNEDIFNFTLVNEDWQKVWEAVSESKRQEEHIKYLNDKIESQENKSSTPIVREIHASRPLGEIQNLCSKNVQVNTTVSPSKSPRTIKFKRFTRDASIDVRKQLQCMKCQLPAKITEEKSGEEWAECTNIFCSFQFCSLCKSPRHTGKECFQFDLDGPSPSKRISKKEKCVAGSKKSRQKLKRLNF